MPRCAQCNQENPEIARFCLACGASLAEVAPPAEERKVVTGLFVDVVGSTARAEQLDPEDVRAMLGPYHTRVRTELERFGGTMEKFIGDAVFALFGAPIAREDDPERAVRAALAIRDAVADLNEGDAWLDLRIRIGITTGEALVMLDAQPSEGDWMAAGDIVNSAARIQSGAPPGGILVGQLTYEATRHTIDYRDIEPVQAKGKAEPVQVWEVAGIRESPGPRRARLPLVGREAEVEAICALWDDVLRERRSALATVTAAPGIGKTRLLEEVAERVSDTAAVYWARCLSYGEGITYWPVTEIFKSAAGIRQSDDAETTSRKLATLLESLPTAHQDDLRTMAAALSNLVGAATTPRGTYVASEIGQAELHWGIRRLLELLASFRPLVLIFEDVHWAEPTLLELLRFVGRAPSPLLLLGSARPEIAETAPEFLAGNRTVLELDAFDDETSGKLLRRLLQGTELPDATVEALLRNAGGNPLFLEETVRMLEASSADVDALPVPTSLQSLIDSRLDQLPGTEKRLVLHASVVGGVFWSGAVAHLDGTNGDVEPGLRSLERRDLVRAQLESTLAGEREYAFKHLLIRDVAYGRLPKGQRAGLHLRFAEWVQLFPGGEEFVEIVAYHLEQSCRFAREVARSSVEPPVAFAVAALTRAAEKAERREGLREAYRFYSRALDVLADEDVELALELQLSRARTSVGLGELRQANEELLQVAEDALARGRLDLRCAALVALANIDYKHGRADSSRTRLDEAGALATQVGDVRLEIRVRYESAQSKARAGAAETAVEDLTGAVRLAEQLDDRALRIEGHMRIGTILFNLGSLGAAEREFAQAGLLAGELGSHRDEARTTTQLAFVKYYRGELAEADRLALQAHEWLERTGDTFFQLQNAILLGLIALAADDARQAEHHLRVALPTALESGGWVLLLIYRYLAESLVRQERLADAAELVSFAERDVQPEDLYARAMVGLAQASVAEAEGNASVTTARYTEALALLEPRRVALDVADARIAFARALRRFGDDPGARAQLQLARETLADVDARLLLETIDRELTELASGAGTAGPAAAS